MFQPRKFQRTIDPAAASPFRRRYSPIRVIIERDKDEWLIDLAKPNRGQIMKIARAVENEWREAPRKFMSKRFDDSGRRAETQARPPFARFDRG